MSRRERLRIGRSSRGSCRAGPGVLESSSDQHRSALLSADLPQSTEKSGLTPRHPLFHSCVPALHGRGSKERPSSRRADLRTKLQARSQSFLETLIAGLVPCVASSCRSGLSQESFLRTALATAHAPGHPRPQWKKRQAGADDDKPGSEERSQCDEAHALAAPAAEFSPAYAATSLRTPGEGLSHRGARRCPRVSGSAGNAARTRRPLCGRSCYPKSVAGELQLRCCASREALELGAIQGLQRAGLGSVELSANVSCVSSSGWRRSRKLPITAAALAALALQKVATSAAMASYHNPIWCSRAFSLALCCRIVTPSTTVPLYILASTLVPLVWAMEVAPVLSGATGLFLAGLLVGLGHLARSLQGIGKAALPPFQELLRGQGVQLGVGPALQEPSEGLRHSCWVRIFNLPDKSRHPQNSQPRIVVEEPGALSLGHDGQQLGSQRKGSSPCRAKTQPDVPKAGSRSTDKSSRVAEQLAGSRLPAETGKRRASSVPPTAWRANEAETQDLPEL